MRRPTLVDVAREAGVSVATAGRVMSGSGAASAAAREAVTRAAAALAYTPSRTGRHLVTGRSDVVGMVVPDIANPFFAQLARAAQQRAAAAGLDLVIADTDGIVAREREVVRRLIGWADGLVLAAPRLPTGELTSLGRAPLVLVNRPVAGLPIVLTDASPGLREATDALLAAGHRVVAVVVGPRGAWSATGRRDAVLRRLAAAGAEGHAVGPVEATSEGGGAVLPEVLASGATAVVCYNDEQALGLLAAARAAGISVPAQLAVVGVDDVPSAGLVTPALTTVRMPADAAGRKAVELLLSGAVEVHALVGELVVRESASARRPTARDTRAVS